MTTFIIQSDIPVPKLARKGGSRRSELWQAIANLTPGQCITLPCSSKDEVDVMRRKVHSARAGVRREYPERQFTTRQMLGEVNGKLVPVVRIWRQDDKAAA